MTLPFCLRLAALLVCTFAFAANGAEPPPPSAAELAAKLSAKEEGSSYIRVRMESGGATLQIQIKSRLSHSSGDLVYQVLFPNDRKGEAVLLHRSGGRSTITTFKPPSNTRSAQLSDPLLGTELSCEDVIDSPFTWEQQAIVGTENIDRVSCQILESKPGKGRRSSYTAVRTWVDPRRFVPLRIEKYGDGGKLIRQISTTRVLLDGGDSLPANLHVRGPSGGVTEIDGSRLKRGVSFTDAEFTPEGIRELAAPKNAPQ